LSFEDLIRAKLGHKIFKHPATGKDHILIEHIKEEDAETIISVSIEDMVRLFSDIFIDTSKRPLMTYIREKSVREKMGWERIIDKWREEGIEF